MTDIKIATSRYANQAAIATSGLVPVRITLGRPRFPLRYTIAAEIRILAPTGSEFQLDDWAEFERRYIARLERYGPSKVGQILEEVTRAHDDRGLVLLCFEDVHSGGRCHRRTFASWWLYRTGNPVLELPE